MDANRLLDSGLKRTQPMGQKLPWFMAMAPPPNPAAGRPSLEAKAAVLSAALHSPRLAPYLLYVGGVPDALTAWMDAHGVRVVFWNLTISGSLPLSERQPGPDGRSRLGVYGKLEVPLAVQKLREGGELPADVLPELALYTDSDVRAPLSVSPRAALHEKLPLIGDVRGACRSILVEMWLLNC